MVDKQSQCKYVEGFVKFVEEFREASVDHIVGLLRHRGKVYDAGEAVQE